MLVQTDDGSETHSSPPLADYNKERLKNTLAEILPPLEIEE